MHWLPLTCPKNTHLIVSTDMQANNIFPRLVSRLPTDNRLIFLDVSELDEETLDGLVQRSHKQFSRCLSQQQLQVPYIALSRSGQDHQICYLRGFQQKHVSGTWIVSILKCKRQRQRQSPAQSYTSLQVISVCKPALKYVKRFLGLHLFLTENFMLKKFNTQLGN